MTMLDRVAAQLCGPVWDDLNAQQRDVQRAKARALLGLMREPSETMIKSGAYAGPWHDCLHVGTPEENAESDQEAALDVWCAMIDAALAEKPECLL